MNLKGNGLIGTIIYHILLLLLLIFTGLTFPDPPPEEEGILVNFGTDETGFGDYEPQGDDQAEGAVSEEVQQESVPEEAAAPAVESTPPPEPVAADQTQDVEESPIVEKPQPTAKELADQKQAELDRQKEIERQAEIERQKEIERQAEIERQRVEREKQEKKEAQDALGRNAFSKPGVGEADGSEGITEGNGNQGVETGSPDADRYDTGGGMGNGITVGGLGSRRGLGLPKPNVDGCNIDQRIEVTVDIQVDRNGKVVSATVQKATYQDKCIWDMVVEAALKSTFSADQAANYRQTGWIKYIITPN